MTFSRTAGMGVGYVVPCARTVRNPAQLLEEADALAAAEGFGTGPFWPRWGAVAMLRSPSLPVSQEIKDVWSEYFLRRANSADLLRFSEPDGSTLVCSEGLLNIDWPHSSALSEFDILFATANVPTVINGRYAAPSEIAASLVQVARSADYFRNNVISGIRTLEDCEIWRHIASLAPKWAEGNNSAVFNALCCSDTSLSRGPT